MSKIQNGFENQSLLNVCRFCLVKVVATQNIICLIISMFTVNDLSLLNRCIKTKPVGIVIEYKSDLFVMCLQGSCLLFLLNATKTVIHV